MKSEQSYRMADEMVTGTDQRPSLASGAAYFGALVLAWATYMTLGLKGGPLPYDCPGDCIGVSYTPVVNSLLHLLLYSALVYALVIWFTPWSGPTAFLTVLYAGSESLLTVFLLIKFGPLYNPLVTMSAVVGTFLIAYGIFACPDPLKSSPPMIDS